MRFDDFKKLFVYYFDEFKNPCLHLFTKKMTNYYNFKENFNWLALKNYLENIQKVSFTKILF